MATKNDITGDAITSKANSDAYRNSPFWKSLETKKNVKDRRISGTEPQDMAAKKCTDNGQGTDDAES